MDLQDSIQPDEIYGYDGATEDPNEQDLEVISKRRARELLRREKEHR